MAGTSRSTDRIVNTLVCAGAAVVIFGAWAKILHKPFADTMLTVGLLTEAAIFLLYAFLPPPGQEMAKLADALPKMMGINQGNPALQTMESDVEALLVNRVGAEAEYFKVPIDECYRLVGLIRKNWKGLSGGTEVWTQIQNFFSTLKAQRVGSQGDAREEAVNA